MSAFALKAGVRLFSAYSVNQYYKANC